MPTPLISDRVSISSVHQHGSRRQIQTPDSPLGRSTLLPCCFGELQSVSSLDIDILACPRCGGTLRVIADVTDPRVIQTILDHVLKGVARAPPGEPNVVTQ